MRLTVAQLARLSTLLDEALPLDAAARRLWLDALDAADLALSASLEAALFPDASALADVDRLESLPRCSPDAQAPASPQRQIDLKAGLRVGPYELIRRLGTGGMAEVWLARRVDGAYQRAVALKLPVLLHLRQDLARRFAHERDILAGLEHIHIARFYDAGVTPDNLPYLAMEYVAGESLTQWCDKRQLPVRARIELFLQVIDAVQYAHARHIVHRDIKPSNILVTDSGEVRLLDFGVARMLDGTDGARTQLTEVYGRALTPDYASPEHLKGEPAEIGNDIWSLGVVLSELLTGVRPVGPGAAAPGVTCDSPSADVNATPPSARIPPEAGAARGTSLHKLARTLRGDLDAIVLKALARDPAGRYLSALALGDDLRRWLGGHPVRARSAQAGYEIGKFLGRHGVALASSLGVLLGAGALVFAVLHQRPAQPADTAPAPAAVAAPEKSIAVLPFADRSEKGDQAYFSDGLADELLHRLSRIPGLHVAARTSAFAFKGKPDDIPTIARKLMVAHVLEGSVRKTGDTMRISVQLVSAVDGYQIWSETYDRHVDDIFKVQEEIATAVAKALKAALAPGSPPERALVKGGDSYFLFLRARDLMYRTGDYGKVAAQLEQICRADPGFAPAWAELSFVRSEVAFNARDHDEAHWNDFRQAARKAIALDPQFAGGHVSLAKIYMYHDWNWSGAQMELRRALDLEPGDWATLQFSALLANMLANFDDAFDYLRRAQAVDPLNGFSFGLLATTAYKAGRLDDAQAALDREKTIFPGDSNFLFAVGGDLKMARGRYAEALADYERLPRKYGLYGIVAANFALGRRAQSDAALAEYEQAHGNDDAVGIAAAHAFRNERDTALFWLERGQRQDEDMSDLKSNPKFRNISGDPRYIAVLRSVNLL